MTRRLTKIAPWAAIVVVAAGALVIGSHRSSPPESITARARTIAEGIRCPTCEGQTVANSTVYAAKAIEADIAQRLGAGESPAQIRAYLVSRYGTSILESPPAHGVTALVWILPAVIVPAAAVALIVGLRGSRPSARPVTEADRALVAAALRAPIPAEEPGGPTAEIEPPGSTTDVGSRSPPEPAGTVGREQHTVPAGEQTVADQRTDSNQPAEATLASSAGGPEPARPRQKRATDEQ